MTFEQWQETRFPCPDLGEYLGDDTMKGYSGFVYAETMFIARTASPLVYWTIAERDEIEADLFECERWLWANFANAEINHTWGV